MIAEHGIRPDEVEEIVLDPPTQYRMHSYEEGFSSLMEAQFSIPFVLAAACWIRSPAPTGTRPNV